MMALIFLILLISILLAWMGARKAAIGCFVIMMLLAILWFLHHVTSSLSIQI